MTKQFLTAALTFISAIIFAQQPLQWMPANPQPGATIQITYTAPAGKKTEPFTLYILEYAQKKPTATEVPLEKINGRLVGRFATGKNARSAVMAVKNGEKWDNNNGEGYFIQFYQADGKPVAGADAAAATLYRDWSAAMELDRNVAKTYARYEEAFKKDPALRTEFLESYLRVMTAPMTKDEAKTAVLQVLEATEKENYLSESTRQYMIKTYDKLGATEKAAKARDKSITLYPNGWAVREQRRKAINEQADTDAKIKLLESFRADFPTLEEDEQNEMNRIWASTLRNLGNNNRWDDLQRYSNSIPPGPAAGIYNGFALKLADSGADIERAAQMAKQTYEWGKTDLNTPRPAQTFESDWLMDHQFNLAAYADTYASVLQKKGNNKEALSYQMEAVELSKRENQEINERYTELLESNNAPELEKELESFILRNLATAKMKDQYKAALGKHFDEKHTAEKIAAIEKQAKANKREELINSMIEKKAPAFTLKDFSGADVSLESLAGKIVVVDFWATWCGPCKASFPGMQKTVDKYENDANIVFLFVDTWENGAEKEKNAAKFISEKGYDFRVLMDNDNKVVGNFGVSGIPTKFIIDKKGIVRFKAVGFDGSDDALVEEMSEMIGILQAM